MRVARILLLSSLLAAAWSCSLFWDGQDRILVRTDTSLVLDSVPVQRLIHDEDVLGKMQNQELTREALLHRAYFLQKLRSYPSAKLKATNRVVVIARTSCRCVVDAHDSAEMIKVRAVNGPARGAVGWLCDESVSHSPPML
jgi:hypothetical protein